MSNPLPESAYDPLDSGIAGGGDSRRREREDDDGEAIDMGVQAGGPGEPVRYHVPCDDVAEVMAELKPPGKHHNCFACRYVGQERGVKIPDHRLASVLQTMSDGIGEAWPPALAVTVARQYEAWRIIINASAGPEVEPLPVWNAASVLEHWKLHTCDPEIHQWLHLTYLQYSICKIRRSCLEWRDPVTGTDYHDKDQFQIMTTAMRTWYAISAKEPRKLSYFNESSMINTKSMSNGGVSRSSRPVYEFQQRRNKRYRVAGGDVGNSGAGH